MKRRLSLLLSLCLLNACTTVYTPQGEKQPAAQSQHTVVNNTHYHLDVFVDGVLAYNRITPGQVVSVRSGVFTTTTVVVVTAYDGDGTYRGASSFTFTPRHAYAWIVNIGR